MKLLGTKDAARLLRVSERRIRFFCEKKRLGTKVGGNWIIAEEELKGFKRHPRGRPKQPRH